jgi:peptidoglycan/xylan/chitin deacetylase (PgdA/CDA1 family)
MNRAALMYHDVVVPGADDASGFPGSAAAHYKLDVTAFARHLAALAQSGLSFDSVLTSPDADSTHCLLTFDDGGASAAAVATVLAEHGMIGHFFITTAHIGTPGFVTYGDVLALRAAGHIVGTHSHTHPTEMSRLSPAALAAEWQLSTDRLSQLLGEPVTVGSVPGGFYSTDVARAAAATGIRYLFTSEPTTNTWKVDGCTVLGRYALWHDSPASQAVALAMGTGGARQLQWLSWNTKKPLKRWARPVYRVVRGSLLRAR